MCNAEQASVIDFLSRPETYGLDGNAVERLETHISVVFLAGQRAFKLKRAVKFPYLDFSTLDMRREACRREIVINRRTAPDIYLSVLPVTRDADGRLALGGSGTPVEWLVEMVRFDQDGLFDRRAASGRLGRPLLEDTAQAIAAFHQAAEILRDHGGAAAMTAIVNNNDRCFAQAPKGTFDSVEIERLRRQSTDRVDRLAVVLDRRRAEGRVRRCHGDLHLRNIVEIGGAPRLFDAIEFSEDLACIDVLYDLAFLLMDLDHRNLRDGACVVLNRYTDITADEAGLATLPLFLSLRAAIRSHVSAAANQTEAGRAYLRQALAYLEPSPPRLIAVGGLSGTGKSSLAAGLAPSIGRAPGARLLRSDVLRKRLAGRDAFDRLGPEAYTPEMSRRTYQALCETSTTVLEGGHSVIADAVFADPGERGSIEAVAARAGVSFQGLWLVAPASLLEERVSGRRRDASDATAEVVRHQLGYDLGTIGWNKIDAAGPPADSLAAAKLACGIG